MRASFCLVGLLGATVVAAPPARPEPTAQTRELARATATAGWTLYESSKPKEGNHVVSPLGLSVALAPAFAGAKGKTAEELAGVGRFDLPAAALLKGLDQLCTTPRVTVAAGVWLQTNEKFIPEFRDLLTGVPLYKGGLGQLDFEKDPTAATDAINKWVAKATNDRIPALLPADAVTNRTRFVLASAVDLSAEWEFPFKKAATTDQPFHVTKDKKVSVPTMRQVESFSYFASPHAQVAVLPYKNTTLEMVLVLPVAGSELGPVERLLGQGRLDVWLQSAKPTVLDLRLPKFAIESQIDLAKVLASAAPTAFSPDADFSGICPRNSLALGSAVQKVVVRVDEKGTEAAAGTAATGVIKMSGTTFTVDRPFLFALRDRETGGVFFVGRVVVPATK